MGDYQNINLGIEGRTAIITIDHPPANAFDTQTVMDLNEAFDEAFGDAQVKVIIITGAGQFFVAGADVNEINKLQGYDDAYRVVRAGQELFNKIERSTKPVIAAINTSALPRTASSSASQRSSWVSCPVGAAPSD
jgi:enoyl-CoA hydratase